MKSIEDTPFRLTKKHEILLYCVLEALFLSCFFLGKADGVGFFDSLRVSGVALMLACFGQWSVIAIGHLFVAWYNRGMIEVKNEMA